MKEVKEVKEVKEAKEVNEVKGVKEGRGVKKAERHEGRRAEGQKGRRAEGQKGRRAGHLVEAQPASDSLPPPIGSYSPTRQTKRWRPDPWGG